MHRSGTSLTAQWLHKCGLNIGDNLMPAHFSNKDGHFEDMDFHDLHEEIFKTHNIPYGGFENIENFKPTNQDIKKIKQLIDAKNKQNIQWGWKEPRTCLFLREYSQLLPKAKILIVIRDYNSVINSLTRRELTPTYYKIKKSGRLGKIRLLKYKLTIGKKEKKRLTIKYTKATIEYYNRILSTIKNLKQDNYMIFSFEEIQKQDKKIFTQLSTWGFNLNFISINKILKKHLITSKKDKINIPKKLNDILISLTTELKNLIHA